MAQPEWEIDKAEVKDVTFVLSASKGREMQVSVGVDAWHGDAVAIESLVFDANVMDKDIDEIECSNSEDIDKFLNKFKDADEIRKLVFDAFDELNKHLGVH